MADRRPPATPHWSFKPAFAPPATLNYNITRRKFPKLSVHDTEDFSINLIITTIRVYLPCRIKVAKPTITTSLRVLILTYFRIPTHKGVYFNSYKQMYFLGLKYLTFWSSNVVWFYGNLWNVKTEKANVKTHFRIYNITKDSKCKPQVRSYV